MLAAPKVVLGITFKAVNASECVIAYILDRIVASNLDPKLSEDDLQDLVKTSLASVVSCLPDDEEHNLLMMEKTLMALGDLLKELLIKDMSVKTLDVLIQVTM